MYWYDLIILNRLVRENRPVVFIARMTRSIIKIQMRGKQICSYWSDLIIINQWTYKAEEIRKISRKRKHIFPAWRTTSKSDNRWINYVVDGMPNVALFDILYFYSVFFIAVIYFYICIQSLFITIAYFLGVDFSRSTNSLIFFLEFIF